MDILISFLFLTPNGLTIISGYFDNSSVFILSKEEDRKEKKNGKKNDCGKLWIIDLVLLFRVQLESDLSKLIEVRQSSFILCASPSFCLTVSRLDELSTCTKEYPNRWSRHTPPKLKSNRDSLNYSREIMNMLAYAPIRTLFMFSKDFYNA